MNAQRANLTDDLKALLRIPLAPMGSAANWLLGCSFTDPEFGSKTVDLEDIELAEQLLKDPSSWDEQSIINTFEREFASWNGTRGAYSFMGGRVALSAAISAIHLMPGDEVVVPNYTCIVVANAFSFSGVQIRYCDIELETYGPDINSVIQAISGKTKAILVHHLYGLVCRDLEKILDVAGAKGIMVIEDCAHATGATLHGKKVGNFGDVAFFSSEQSKVFSTFNGGLACSNNEEILLGLARYQQSSPFPSPERTTTILQNFILAYRLQNDPCRSLLREYYRFRGRNFAIPSTTRDEISGLRPGHYRQRMPGPIARIGLGQIRKIDHYNGLRRVNAEYWMKACEKNGIACPLVLPASFPVFLRYPIRVPALKKYDNYWARRQFGVRQGVWFSGELHPVGQRLRHCPNAALAVSECINLPTLWASK